MRTQTSNMPKNDAIKGYMPYVDGLRAIAITLVVLYHAGLSWLPGGYIGVDIFFVLSGFLISGQIIKLCQQNQFSFKTFYLRRIRRLMPTYVTVSFAALVAGAFILLPKDFIFHAKAIVLGIISLSNFYFAKSTGGYFDPNVEEIAWIHTWSLSVEEQFYVLWPLAVVLAFRYLTERGRAFALFGLFFLSVIFSYYYTHSNPTNAYYLLPARLHELMLGGLLAYYFSALPALSKQKALLLCAVALVCMIAPAFYYTDSIGFPGLYALIPCFGTALLIYAGRSKNWIISWLSTRPMIGIGKISYAWYLWHWPVFSFMYYVNGELTPILGVTGTVLSLLLSVASWHFVENPLRFRYQFGFQKTALLLFVLPALTLTGLFFSIKALNGVGERFGDKKEAVMALRERPEHTKELCDQSDKKCRQILLMGDSHAEHYDPFIHALAQDAGMQLETLAESYCIPIEGMAVVSLKPRKTKYSKVKCLARNLSLGKILRERNYEYAVLAGFWGQSDAKDYPMIYVDESSVKLDIAKNYELMEKHLSNTIETILAADVTPVIVKDIPVVTPKTAKCAQINLVFERGAACETPVAVLIDQQKFVNALFEKLAGRYPKLQFIEPARVMCNAEKCVTTIDNVPLYRDEDHLNALGSATVGEHYIKRFGNPFYR